MISWFERKNALAWLAVFAIAGAMFYISSIEFKNSSIGGPGNINAVLYHLISYFSLSLFLCIAVVKGERKGYFMLVLISIVMAFLYGVTDEIHQYFVPGRSMAVSDLMINLAGITLASLTYAIRIELKKH
jgi:uncharacterized membrane protein